MTHLERLYRVADDVERVVLDGLAIRAGIMRQCECTALVIAGKQCMECGRTPAAAAAPTRRQRLAGVRNEHRARGR